ncbi:MAG TPA: SDR family oxidoreductase [Candidatus Acidoferrum sp.]|nr:SDR family oxidoreductase [Candidatus Acidoferrum sp.]
MRILIIGCGYVGLPLGVQLLRQGHAVFGLRRSAEGAAILQRAGLQPLLADITRPGDLAGLPLPYDWIVNTISSGGGGAPAYQRVYFEGTRNLLQWLAASPPRQYVHTGSTSVYGQTDASAVEETSPAEPASPTGRILLAAEKLLLDSFREKQFPAVLLRLAAIYGPGRARPLLQYLKGEAKIPGQGERFLNMIHLEDVVGAILAALQHGRPGEIYNLADDEPVSQIDFFRWLAETLGRPMPPLIPESAAAAGRRGATNKRVVNRKLKMELGYALRHPTFRQGYTAEIQRLKEAGML